MSIEEAKFGRARELEDAGYTPVTKADIAPAEPDAIDGSDKEGLRALAADIAERRRDAAPDLVTTFTDADPDKPAAFDAATAAEVVKQSREKYAAENIEPAQKEALDDFARHIDELRGEPTEPQLTAQHQAQEAAREENQRVYQEMLAQHEARQAQQVQQQHSIEAETIRARGNAVVAQLSADFPEVANLPLNQIQGAVAAIEQRDPARARALVQRLQAVDAIYGQHRAMQQRQQQHAQQQHEAFVQSEARKFDAAVANDPMREQAMAGVVDVLRDAGINPEAFVQTARRGDALGQLLASASVHRILFEAAKSRITGRNQNGELQQLRNKLAVDLPPVSRPGSRGSAPIGNAAPSNQKLAAALSSAKGDNALKIATQMLLARRGGR